MSLTLVSTPEKTVNGVLSNVIAGRSQVPFEFLTTDQAEDNFKILVDLLDENDTPYLTFTFKYSPRPDGVLFIDLGRIVTEINEARQSLNVRFKIQYSSEWEGGSTAPVITQEFMAVYAEKQLLSEGGSNMWEYLLSPDALFLTTFHNSTIWDGFIRTYSYVIDSNYTARTGLSEVTTTFNYYDINKNLVDSITRVETDLTPRVVIKAIMPSATPYVGVVIDGLTEEVLYERAPVCSNPIVVDWLNSKGGVDQHIFNFDQLFERDALDGLIWEDAITEDISQVRRTKSRTSATWSQQIILKAENLTITQLKALEEIKSSSSIRVWLNNDGREWIGVVASAKYRTTHNTQDKLHEFTLQLEMPNNFDLEQAINYTTFEPEVLIDSDLEELIDSDNEILIG